MGFAIFDTAVGLPMACGAVLGDRLFLTGSALPFVFVILIAATLLVLLVVEARRTARIGGGRGLAGGPD